MFTLFLKLALLSLAWGDADLTPAPRPEGVEKPVIRYMTADDGTRLAYTVLATKSRHKRPFVIVVGKGETVFRYLELARDMEKRGYGPIYLMDHRGQGYSQKQIKLAIHVNRFDTYADDFIKFMDGPVKHDLAARGIRQKPFLYAHSMGGPIANLMLRKRPDLADRVAYITPMFQIRLSTFMTWLRNRPVRYLTSALRWLGRGERLFGGGTDSLPVKSIATDRSHVLASYLQEVEEGIRTPKASLAWFNEALRAEAKVLGPGKPEMQSLIFQGELDELVTKHALMRYACGAKHCALIEIPGGHSPHQERKEIREIFLDELDAFYRGKKYVNQSGCGPTAYRVLKGE